MWNKITLFKSKGKIYTLIDIYYKFKFNKIIEDGEGLMTLGNTKQTVTKGDVILHFSLLIFKLKSNL